MSLKKTQPDNNIILLGAWNSKFYTWKLWVVKKVENIWNIEIYKDMTLTLTKYKLMALCIMVVGMLV